MRLSFVLVILLALQFQTTNSTNKIIISDAEADLAKSKIKHVGKTEEPREAPPSTAKEATEGKTSNTETTSTKNTAPTKETTSTQGTSTNRPKSLTGLDVLKYVEGKAAKKKLPIFASRAAAEGCRRCLVNPGEVCDQVPIKCRDPNEICVAVSAPDSKVSACSGDPIWKKIGLKDFVANIPEGKCVSETVGGKDVHGCAGEDSWEKAGATNKCLSCNAKLDKDCDQIRTSCKKPGDVCISLKTEKSKVCDCQSNDIWETLHQKDFVRQIVTDGKCITQNGTEGCLGDKLCEKEPPKQCISCLAHANDPCSNTTVSCRRNSEQCIVVHDPTLKACHCSGNRIWHKNGFEDIVDKLIAMDISSGTQCIKENVQGREVDACVGDTYVCHTVHVTLPPEPSEGPLHPTEDLSITTTTPTPATCPACATKTCPPIKEPPPTSPPPVFIVPPPENTTTEKDLECDDLLPLILIILLLLLLCSLSLCCVCWLLFRRGQKEERQQEKKKGAWVPLPPVQRPPTRATKKTTTKRSTKKKKTTKGTRRAQGQKAKMVTDRQQPGRSSLGRKYEDYDETTETVETSRDEVIVVVPEKRPPEQQRGTKLFMGYER